MLYIMMNGDVKLRFTTTHFIQVCANKSLCNSIRWYCQKTQCAGLSSWTVISKLTIKSINVKTLRQLISKKFAAYVHVKLNIYNMLL